MNHYPFLVYVEAETRGQADTVMAERLDHTEDYGFHYQIAYSHDWTYVCMACPDRVAQDRNHCEGCGQHINETPGGAYTGLFCSSKCDEHPSGEHQPPHDVFTRRELVQERQ